MRASIRQVAERAGVSAMTVSNVLRSRSEQTSEETRMRVLRAVQELNYIPVRSAIQNRHVSTNAIGVVFLQDMEGAVGYPTFLGMCARARQLDYDLTIFLRSEPNWVKPGSEAQFLDRRCDGFIFVGANRAEISEALVGHRVPIVECYSVAPPPGVARVLGDHCQGMRLAVEHLAGHGHTRIAHLGGPGDNLEANERADGYRAALRSLTGQSPAEWVVRCETWGDTWGFGPGADEGASGGDTVCAAEAVLALGVTAVVCANDRIALALWRWAEERGLRVPQDLSITGVDNLPQAAYRGLTSVALPFHQVGRVAVDAVMSIINGGSGEAASRILPVGLVERDSVAPPVR
jgi:DNA-binding LacI/PurR family transcriptional regulator